MVEESTKKEIVELEAIDLPMNWYLETMWVDSTIKAMFIANIFPLIGLPIFLIIATVVYFHYQWMNIYSLSVVFDNFDGPVEGKEDWTVSNWFLFPVRRSILFNMLIIVGTVGNLMVPINFIIVPVTGLLTWINNYY